MVSNDEFKEKLSTNKTSENGLLVCDGCEYSYELEPGESPEDFILKCQCGGELNYLGSKREIINKGTGFAEKKSSQNEFLKLIGPVVCLFGVIIFFILLLFGQIAFGMILLVLILSIGIEAYHMGDTDGDSWNKGIVGERTVADYLNQLPEDYFIYNDVKFPESYGNLDHVVIGPNGIFVIETKNYNGFFIVKDDGWYYKKGKYLSKAQTQPGTQVLRNSLSLRNFLVNNNVNMDGVWIDPIVTLIKNNFKINEKPRYYKILFPSTIPNYIENRNNNIDINILQKAIDLLEPYSNELSYLDIKERV